MIAMDARATELREKIVSLWERLEISVDFRESHLEGHQGYKMRVIHEVRHKRPVLQFSQSCSHVMHI